jgi:UDP-2-acetamido-2,6-beta-L-arabino-hexul-4-ose reductase
MTEVSLTGGDGFLGWHCHAALKGIGVAGRDIEVGTQFDLQLATSQVSGTSRLIHLAGVNRGPESTVRDGNIRFAEQMAITLQAAPQPPPLVVYANSIQAGNDTAYGEAKCRAAEILARAAASVGAQFEDIRLPNLFGEGGKPFYNSVTATFCHLLAQGDEPSVETDARLSLLHAQNAADVLIGEVPGEGIARLTSSETVSGLLGRLREQARIYDSGEIPDVSASFDRDLFNTYQSYAFRHRTNFPLMLHRDGRGAFFEEVRCRGSASQTSCSVTAPGISRGDHFHRRKVERFIVVAGHARISLRCLGAKDVIHLDVSGEAPTAVDMPTMWAHRIHNTGQSDLLTNFWTNEPFNPLVPDTISEMV